MQDLMQPHQALLACPMTFAQSARTACRRSSSAFVRSTLSQPVRVAGLPAKAMIVALQLKDQHPSFFRTPIVFVDFFPNIDHWVLGDARPVGDVDGDCNRLPLGSTMR